MINKTLHKYARWASIWLFLLFSGIVFTPQKANAQFLEYGGGIGFLNYAGDLNRGYPVENIGVGITLLHRMNLSDIVSIKYAGGIGKISGSDENAFDAFGNVRNRSFSRNVIEGTLTLEYNFLDYKHEHSPIRWSPYLFGGVGFAKLLGEQTGDYNDFQPILPFGLGFKHLIGKQFSLGLEFGLRKTFFDELDEVSGGDQEIKDFNYGNPETNDWYSFTSITLTYILYEIPCPFRYIPNRSIYRN